VTQTWLSEPDDEDIADQFAKASEGFEALSRDMSDILDALEATTEAGAYEREHIDRLESVYELLDDYREDVVERQQKYDPQKQSAESHTDPDGSKQAGFEATQPPDDYERLPMPELEIVGREGFGGDTLRVRFRKTDDRHVEHPLYGPASQWLAHVPTVNSSRHANYEWADFSGDEDTFPAQIGSVLAIGVKRHDAEKTHELVGVTDDRLERFGSEDEGRANAKEFLKSQEDGR
jgi:hypothetical protein